MFWTHFFPRGVLCLGLGTQPGVPCSSYLTKIHNWLRPNNAERSLKWLMWWEKAPVRHHRTHSGNQLRVSSILIFISWWVQWQIDKDKEMLLGFLEAQKKVWHLNMWNQNVYCSERHQTIVWPWALYIMFKKWKERVGWVKITYFIKTQLKHNHNSNLGCKR